MTAVFTPPTFSYRSRVLCAAYRSSLPPKGSVWSKVLSHESPGLTGWSGRIGVNWSVPRTSSPEPLVEDVNSPPTRTRPSGATWICVVNSVPLWTCCPLKLPETPLAFNSTVTTRSEEHTSELQSQFHLVC